MEVRIEEMRREHKVTLTQSVIIYQLSNFKSGLHFRIFCGRSLSQHSRCTEIFV